MEIDQKTKSKMEYILASFSPQRLSDRPSWILISKTPARKSKVVAVIIVFVAQAFKAALKAELDCRNTNMFKLRRNPILGK